ncbi:MAG: response regulator [bacterium]
MKESLRSDQTEQIQHQSQTLRNILFAILVVILIAPCLWFALLHIENSIREKSTEQLSTFAASADLSLSQWHDRQTAEIKSLADSLDVLAPIRLLHSIQHTQEALLKNNALASLRTTMQRFVNPSTNRILSILGSDSITIFSYQNDEIGRISQFIQSDATILKRVLAGNSFWTFVSADQTYRPQESAGRIALMLYATPLLDENGKPLAALLVGLNPDKEFSALFQLRPTGATGKLTAIDRQGKILFTSSKLSEPLSSSTPEISKSDSGMKISGYSDFRGVTVLGAWRWNPKLNIGLVAEIDEEEAISAIPEIRLIIIGMIILTALLLIVFFGILLRERKIMMEQIQTERGGLERVLTERTSELSTQRQAAERHLSTLNAILSTMPDFIYMKSIDGKYLLCNEAYAQFLRKAQPEIFGKSDFDLFPFETANSIMESDQLVLTNNQTYEHQEWIELPDGQKRCILTRKILHQSKDGKINTLIGIGRDITELAQQQESVRQLQHYAQDLLESSNDAVFLIDPSLKILSFNKQREPLFGYTQEELSGKHLSDLFPYQSGRIEAMTSAAPTNDAMASAETMELTAQRKDTSEFPAQVRIISTITNLGPLFIVSVCNLSDRIHREALLRRSTEEIDLLREAIQDGLWEWDLRTNEICFSKPWHVLFGFGEDESPKYFSSFEELIHPDDRERVQQELTDYTEGKTSIYNSEYRLQRKDGTYGNILARGKALRDSHGVAFRMAGTHQDISERIAASNALASAQHEAASANLEKNVFLSLMSHEIRTPMNGIIGMTGLLLETELSHEQREYAATIQKSSDDLLTLMNNILDFTILEANRLELEHQPFDVTDCVEHAIDEVTAEAQAKDLNLAFLVEKEVPHICMGDSKRLQQVLLNLLKNAVAYTDQGEIMLTVHAEETSIEADEFSLYSLHFSVQDTGIGISPEMQHSIFQAFTQADGSTTRRFGGIGLGLSICKHLVELMGGSLWIESEVGKGSTFHFTTKAQSGSMADHSELRGSESQLRGCRVLIVDDNPTNRYILRKQTTSWGMIPHETGSPLEALEWIRRGNPFDLGILDMQMPEMDGLMLAAEIRQHRDSTAMPMIMLSSVGNQSLGAKSKLFTAILSKPIKASQLYNILIETLPLRPAPEYAENFPLDEKMAHQLPLRILLAEDHIVNQTVALHLLKKLGYTADVVSNGLKALEALEQRQYDVLFMDIQMPEMDGLEATRQIRKQFSPDQQPRIIAMTAHALDEDRMECFAAGMDDYLLKPINIEQLQQSLAQMAQTADAKRDDPLPLEPVDEPIDWTVLERLQILQGEDDPRFLQRLLEDYVKETPESMERIQLAMLNGDAEDILHHSHILRMASYRIGARFMGLQCEKLERLAREHRLKNIGTIAEELLNQFERVDHMVRTRFSS